MRENLMDAATVLRLSCAEYPRSGATRHDARQRRRAVRSICMHHRTSDRVADRKAVDNSRHRQGDVVARTIAERRDEQQCDDGENERNREVQTRSFALLGDVMVSEREQDERRRTRARVARIGNVEVMQKWSVQAVRRSLGLCGLIGGRVATI